MRKHRWRRPESMEEKQMPVGVLDVVITAENNVHGSAPDASQVDSVTVSEFQANRGAATMSKALGAGFYSNSWGPLPYAFGRVPKEVYTLSRIGAGGGVEAASP